MSNNKKIDETVHDKEQMNAMLSMARRIKPVVSFCGHGKVPQGLNFIRESDIMWHNYAPHPVESAENLQEEQIIRVKHIPTVDRYGRPTTYDVLSQIPVESQKGIVAFQVKKIVERVPDFENRKISNVVEVVLYSGKLPTQVAEQSVIINGITIPTPKMIMKSAQENRRRDLSMYR